MNFIVTYYLDNGSFIQLIWRDVTDIKKEIEKGMSGWGILGIQRATYQKFD